MTARALVDTGEAWSAAAAGIAGASEIALDVEADGFHRYPERVALLQVALTDGTLYLVDPLALHDLDALGRVLADPGVPKVLHSASYDVRSLDRDHGFAIRGLFDTAIAAQFCGARRTGLANVLADFLGVELDKPKHLQRMDWSARPLPAEALAYAAADVAHLLDLKHVLEGHLTTLDRLAWVDEECRRLEQVRYEPPAPPEEAFLAVRGARDLDNAERAVLRELCVWREGEALRIRRPPHRVMSNALLVHLSQEPSAPIDRLRGYDHRLLARSGVRHRFETALARGRAAPPVPWPRRGGPNPWTADGRARLVELKRWRAAEAERLDLEAGVVWSAQHLDQVALKPAAPSRALDDGDPPWVRDWQWAALGGSLEVFRREVLGDRLS